MEHSAQSIAPGKKSGDRTPWILTKGTGIEVPVSFIFLKRAEILCVCLAYVLGHFPTFLIIIILILFS